MAEERVHRRGPWTRRAVHAFMRPAHFESAVPLWQLSFFAHAGRSCRSESVSSRRRGRPGWRAGSIDAKSFHLRFVGVSDESSADRERRLARRVLFNSVAELYQRSRRGYPDELVDWMLATASVDARDPVLEVGCGTGQLTHSLAVRGVDLTAIDIGPSMVETARRHVDDPSVRFTVSAFENFEAADASFALVASATAIHWVDPGVRWSKTARLLKPGGCSRSLSPGNVMTSRSARRCASCGSP